MNFPFLCFLLLLSLFGTIAWLFRSTHRPGDGAFSPVASSKRFGHLTSLIFSDYLRGWFFVSLLLEIPLVLFGAALLFSLSWDFTPSAASLGSLSVLDGLGILLLGMHRP